MYFDINKLTNGETCVNACNLSPENSDVLYGYEDVTFVGYLCSATKDVETGEKCYFTVNKTGKALDAYTPNAMGKFRTSAVNFSIANKPETKTKPRHVTVIRHFRKFNSHNEISNFGGVTVLCVLDYETLRMRVYPAFCSDTCNFNKDLAIDIAMMRCQMDDGIECYFDRDNDIRTCLYNAISDRTYTFTTGHVGDARNISLYRKFRDSRMVIAALCDSNRWYK